MASHNTFKLILAAMSCLSVFAFAQIPTIRITTATGGDPTTSNASNCSGLQNAQNTNVVNAPYISINEIKVEASDSRHSFTRTKSVPSLSDSIRIRGNSTAGAAKKPYRIKFDQKVSMFGRPAAKSWTLLANYYDATFALNAMAFRLAEKVGLNYSPKFFFVNLYINNTYKGIYQMTDQIQVGEASVNIDKDNGWLVELDYHAGGDAAECRRYFNPGQYNLSAKVRHPDIDDLPKTNNLPDTTHYRCLKSDISNFVNKLNATDYSYRDYVDLDSWVRYVFVQLLLDNFDFNNKAETARMLGSNYLYKAPGEKIKAGPIWDFDLAAGVTTESLMGGGYCWTPPCNTSSGAHFNNYTDMQEPTNAFYLKLWADPVFKARYKQVWTTHQSSLLTWGNSLIDSIATLLNSSVANNTYGISAMSSGTLNESAFTSQINSLKTWWSNRLNTFATKMNSISGTDIAESNPAPDNTSCRVAVSSSSGNGASSSSNGATTGCTQLTGNETSISGVNTNNCFTYTCNGDFQMSASQANRATNISGNNCSKAYTVGTSYASACENATDAYTITYTGNTGNITFNLRCIGSTPIMLSQIANENSVLAIKSGVNLQVKETAHLEIYSMNGKLAKIMNFKNGVYNVSLGELPKGMYIVKASFGKERKTLRTVVK